MDVALDSVEVQHLLLTPRAGGKSPAISTALDQYIDRKALRVRVDPDCAIIDEWRETCGREYVEVLVVRWSDAGGLLPVKKVGRYSASVGKKLRLLGFDDTIDKLLVRVAMVLNDKAVVSRDSDFWNPQKPTGKRWVGDRNAPVAKVLRDHLGITVYTLKMLLTQLATA